MIILDLHRTRHEDVENKCHRFINSNWGRPLKIITGNSREMQKIVCRIIEAYNLEFHVGDIAGNGGFIKIRSLND